MPDLPVLYSFRRCPYAMRARMALLASGQACEVREIMLRDKPAEMIAVSPKATVPVLTLPDGRVIDESMDIMRWTLARSDPQRWLAGDDAALIAQNDGPFKHHLDRYKYPDRHDADPLMHRGKGLDILAGLDARLADRANLCGDGISLADIAIMPFVRQFAATDRNWFDALPLSGLQSWLARHIASPLFEKTMIRRAPWQPSDQVQWLDSPPK